MLVWSSIHQCHQQLEKQDENLVMLSILSSSMLLCCEIIVRYFF